MLRKSLFPGQQSDEQIYLVVREHWFVLFLKLLVWLLFVVILFAFDHYLPIYVPAALADPYGPYVALFKNVYTIFLILGLFMIWALYYLNIQVITNYRIVDIDQESLLNHRVSELHIEKIEDVTGETKGLLGNIFAYGNVYVQTAGHEEHFVFQNVPAPDKVEKLLLDLYEQMEKQTGVIHTEV